jgi:hypothetical protein
VMMIVINVVPCAYYVHLVHFVYFPFTLSIILIFTAIEGNKGNVFTIDLQVLLVYCGLMFIFCHVFVILN